MTSFWEDMGDFTEDITSYVNKRNTLNMLLESSLQLFENKGEGNVQKVGKQKSGPKIIVHKLAFWKDAW